MIKKSSRNVNCALYTDDNVMIGTMSAVTSDTQPIPSLCLNVHNQEAYEQNKKEVAKEYETFKGEHGGAE